MGLLKVECDYCGLIWHGEMLNLVKSDAEREQPLKNYCPNCGKEQ